MSAHESNSIVRAAAASAVRFLRLAAARRVRLRRDRVGKTFIIDRRGTYRIFRETVSDDGCREPSVVLVVGFRLRVLRAQTIPHWLFERACMLTTPFWSGFPGFRVKLWMADPQTKDYLGIYEWAGRENAQLYGDTLVRVLRPLSTVGSVWYEIYPHQRLEPYLKTREHPGPYVAHSRTSPGPRHKNLLAGVAAVVLAPVAMIGFGRALFERRMKEEIAALLAASAVTEPAMVSEHDLAALPDPVQRWLRWARVIGKPFPATVRIEQAGRFRQAEREPWMPFTAVEYFTTDPPAFLWKATMRLGPGLAIIGRDRYAEGRGSIEMRLLGLVPVAQASGPALDQGALLRYLNETVWFPAAALSPYITWEPVDAHAARATMRYSGVTGMATFVFDDTGRPIDVIAERQDMSRGRLETWSTPLHDYGEFAGVRVPVSGQGVWRYDSGDFPYIEPRITALEINRSP